MCYSANVSLTTFLLSIVTSSLLIKKSIGKYAKTTKIIAYFFIYIAVVQLLEYFMWIDLDCSNGFNKISTKLIPYIIYLQPCMIFFIGTLFKKNLSPLLWLINLIYLVVVVLILNSLNLQQCSKPGNNGHLVWNRTFETMPIFLICYFILAIINIFGVLDFTYAWFTFLILTLSFSYSYFYIYGSIGEMWCFLGALLPIFILIYQWLVVEKK